MSLVQVPIKCLCGRTCDHGNGYYCTQCDGSGPPKCHCGNLRFGIQGRLCEACLYKHHMRDDRPFRRNIWGDHPNTHQKWEEWMITKRFAEKQMREAETENNAHVTKK